MTDWANILRELPEPDDNPFARLARLDMARIDRAKIRWALRTRKFAKAPAEPSSVDLMMGIELRVNPWIPEGIMAAFDGRGELLGLIDTRGDHDPSRVPSHQLPADD